MYRNRDLLSHVYESRTISQEHKHTLHGRRRPLDDYHLCSAALRSCSPIVALPSSLLLEMQDHVRGETLEVIRGGGGEYERRGLVWKTVVGSRE